MSCHPGFPRGVLLPAWDYQLPLYTQGALTLSTPFPRSPPADPEPGPGAAGGPRAPAPCARRTPRTFVVHPQVVLRQADVAELVLRAPGPRQRRLLLVHSRVKALQPPLQLLLLLVQGRVPVREGRRGAAARRRGRGRGRGASGRAGARGEARGSGGRAGGGGRRSGWRRGWGRWESVPPPCPTAISNSGLSPPQTSSPRGSSSPRPPLRGGFQINQTLPAGIGHLGALPLAGKPVSQIGSSQLRKRRKPQGPRWGPGGPG